MKRVPVDPSTLVRADSVERIIIPNNEAGRQLVHLLFEARAHYLAKQRANAQQTEVQK